MATNPPPAEGEIRQVLVHPVVWPRLEAWLLGRGIELCNISSALDDDDLATYVMTPIAPLRDSRPDANSPETGQNGPSDARTAPGGPVPASSLQAPATATTEAQR
jgi:hypothetical protein